MKSKTIFSVAVLCAVAATGCGPSTQPVKAPPPAAPTAADNAQPTMDQFRSGLAQGQKQVDSLLASLASLTDPNQADLRGAYNKYCDQLSRMVMDADTVKREAEAMRSTRDAYYAAWEAKVNDIDNPSIRALADARRKKLREAHEQITTASGEARDAYVPFVKDCQDIRKYLASDLTKASIAEVGDAVKKVQADGATVRDKLGQIITVLDGVQNPS